MNYNNMLKLLKLQQLIYITLLKMEFVKNAVSHSPPKVNFESVLSRVLLLSDTIHMCTS